MVEVGQARVGPQLGVEHSGQQLDHRDAGGAHGRCGRVPRTVGRRFAHPHPSYGGSPHLTLPADLAEFVTRGWAACTPWAGTLLSTAS